MTGPGGARNRRWLLNQRPTGAVGDDQLRLDTAAIPEPGEGEVLVENRAPIVGGEGGLGLGVTVEEEQELH